jgi:KipI family sensor histidine kinase inhibitor
MSDWLHLDGGLLQATNYQNEFVLLRPQAVDKIDLPALGRAILDMQFAFVDEVIATEVEICLKLNERFGPDSLSSFQQLEISQFDESASHESKPFRAPIWFSDADDDWTRVCQHTQLAREQIIEQLLACRFQVAMIGFLPGFLYLNGLPAELQVPRKENPDKRTAAGAFAIGGKYAGIYSLPSPAGWNVVGSLGVELLQTTQLPPLQLQPGDAIVLERTSDAEYAQLARHRPSLLDFNGFSNRH